MDGELVNPPSENEDSPPPKSYGQIFREECPKYMVMGMTYEQYWDGEPELARYYRKADELRSERRNQELWLQGMYVYEAVSDISPILHAFAKKGTKAKPYPTQPYALTSKDRTTQKEKKEKAEYNKGKAYMEAVMANINKRFGK